MFWSPPSLWFPFPQNNKAFLHCLCKQSKLDGSIWSGNETIYFQSLCNKTADQEWYHWRLQSMLFSWLILQQYEHMPELLFTVIISIDRIDACMYELHKWKPCSQAILQSLPLPHESRTGTRYKLPLSQPNPMVLDIRKPLISLCSQFF